MDITNRVVKICRRITDIEFILDCELISYDIESNLRNELERLNNELSTLRPAIVQDKHFAAFVV